jgi:hypothetical protein
MLFLDGAMGLVLFALWIFCLIDVITTDESLVRNLQKTWWILIVLLLFDVGAVIWLVAGRPWPSASGGVDLPYRGNRGHKAGETGFPEYERPGRFAATTEEDDAEFLRRCRERAEEQRRRYRERPAESGEDA